MILTDAVNIMDKLWFFLYLSLK